ncbi:hypothetical protein cypCar_00012563 [Cyprinus carpio]|nr:hypothetical protein cypCar_00012563 [Cyprinus carpio]
MEVETAGPFVGDIGFWAGRTEFHKAAYQGQVSVLQRLIQSGASVNIVAVDSITPLHEAAARTGRRGSGNHLYLQQLRTMLGTRAVDVVTNLDIPNHIISYLLHQ